MLGLDLLDGFGRGLLEEVLVAELLVELLELLRGLGATRLEALLLLGKVDESRQCGEHLDVAHEIDAAFGGTGGIVLEDVKIRELGERDDEILLLLNKRTLARASSSSAAKRNETASS